MAMKAGPLEMYIFELTDKTARQTDVSCVLCPFLFSPSFSISSVLFFYSILTSSLLFFYSHFFFSSLLISSLLRTSQSAKGINRSRQAATSLPFELDRG